MQCILSYSGICNNSLVFSYKQLFVFESHLIQFWAPSEAETYFYRIQTGRVNVCSSSGVGQRKSYWVGRSSVCTISILPFILNNRTLNFNLSAWFLGIIPACQCLFLVARSGPALELWTVLCRSWLGLGESVAHISPHLCSSW